MENIPNNTNKKKKAKLIAKFNEECYVEEQTEVKLALLKMDSVCVTKIACSAKHSLIVSFPCLTIPLSVRIRVLFSPGVRMISASLGYRSARTLQSQSPRSLHVLSASRTNTFLSTWHVATTTRLR